MRGAARLAFPQGYTHPDLLPLPAERAGSVCFVCGHPADGVGRNTETKEGNLNGCFSSSFTDDNKLPMAGVDMCGPCFACGWMAGRKGKAFSKETGSIDITARPKESPGWLLADGAISCLRVGTAGIEDLAGLSRRPDPFGVMVGWDAKITAHHWLLCPAAYPAPRWPMLYIDKTGDRPFFMRETVLDTVLAALAAGGFAGDEGPRKLRKVIWSRVDPRKEVTATSEAVAHLRELLGGGGEQAAVMRRVLFYGAVKEAVPG